MKKLTVIFFAAVFFVSCTGMIWDRGSYTEEIHSLYIDQDNDSFVVLGDAFHYVFKSNKKLLEILKASREIKINPQFYYFDLSKNNTLSGEFAFFVYKDEVSGNDIKMLRKLGFEDTPSNEMLWYDTDIKGIRYKADLRENYGKNLRKKYNVKILEPRNDSAGKTAGKILLTPITVAADVVLVIAGSILYMPLHLTQHDFIGT